MRRRGVKNLSTRIVSHPEILINDAQNHIGKWKKLFGNNNPIHLEIGMGKGDFIIDLAKKNPNINYIGLEKFPSVIVVAMDKVVLSELPNIKLICFDATNLLEIFEENEIDQIYLNFSDPWPKNRHAKRRLTSSSFLSIYEKILKNDKTIQFKTDNRGLFEYSLISFNENNWKFLNLSMDLHTDYDTNTISKTEYEKRFINLGQPIYYVEVMKKESK